MFEKFKSLENKGIIGAKFYIPWLYKYKIDDINKYFFKNAKCENGDNSIIIKKKFTISNGNKLSDVFKNFKSLSLIAVDIKDIKDNYFTFEIMQGFIWNSFEIVSINYVLGKKVYVDNENFINVRIDIKKKYLEEIIIKYYNEHNTLEEIKMSELTVKINSNNLNLKKMLLKKLKNVMTKNNEEKCVYIVKGDDTINLSSKYYKQRFVPLLKKGVDYFYGTESDVKEYKKLKNNKKSDITLLVENASIPDVEIPEVDSEHNIEIQKKHEISKLAEDDDTTSAKISEVYSTPNIEATEKSIEKNKDEIKSQAPVFSEDKKEFNRGDFLEKIREGNFKLKKINDNSSDDLVDDDYNTKINSKFEKLSKDLKKEDFLIVVDVRQFAMPNDMFDKISSIGVNGITNSRNTLKLIKKISKVTTYEKISEKNVEVYIQNLINHFDKIFSVHIYDCEENKLISSENFTSTSKSAQENALNDVRLSQAFLSFNNLLDYFNKDIVDSGIYTDKRNEDNDDDDDDDI